MNTENVEILCGASYQLFRKYTADVHVPAQSFRLVSAGQVDQKLACQPAPSDCSFCSPRQKHIQITTFSNDF